MRSGVTITAVVGVVLALIPAATASNGEVANVARASGLTFKQDNRAINRALEELDLSSLGSVNALVETGFSMQSDMSSHERLLARTVASTSNRGPAEASRSPAPPTTHRTAGPRSPGSSVKTDLKSRQ